MIINIPDGLNTIVNDVQVKIGYIFSLQEISDVLAFTRRKCFINGKGDGYVPVLFENELRDYGMRLIINQIGEMNKCAKFAAETSV